jgi:DNA adenine methylase
MKVRRPPLRYHGAKWKLAPWLIGFFPPHRIYTEAFAGSACVLMRKPRAYAEVYNDRWSTVVNVFQVLRDPTMAPQLREQLFLTPFARDEFDLTAQPFEDVTDPIERARRTILRSLAGFGSASTNNTHSTGFRANSNRSGTTPAQDWMHYPDHVAAFTERLRGVIIENRDATSCLIQHDSPQTLHYVDPPYPHSTRNMQRGNAAYAEEMTDDDHRGLADVLRSLSGMVVLSGYPCDLYDRELFAGWERHECAHLADGARRRTEVV